MKEEKKHIRTLQKFGLGADFLKTFKEGKSLGQRLSASAGPSSPSENPIVTKGHFDGAPLHALHYSSTPSGTATPLHKSLPT